VLEFFGYGISHNVAPLAMARLLLFCGVMWYCANTRLKIIFYGFGFIVVSIVVETLISLGSMDSLFLHPWFGKLFPIILVGEALIFILVGFAQIFDWRYLKKNSQRLLIRPSAFLTVSGIGNRSPLVNPAIPQSRFWMVVLVILGACLASIFSGFVQSEFVFQAYSFLLSRQNAEFIITRYAVYLSGVMLPMMAIWVSLIFLENPKKISLGQFSLGKIVFSAVCFATGVGLGLNFWLNFKSF
jgi:hypothetical protein